MSYVQGKKTKAHASFTFDGEKARANGMQPGFIADSSPLSCSGCSKEFDRKRLPPFALRSHEGSLMGHQRYEAFLKVAETGSFKQAAHDLGYTQAGISYAVNALEAEWDTILFAREYGGVRLTSEGADLLPWVQDVSNAERRLAAHLADLKHLEGGTLRVVAFTSASIQWLPSISKRFLEEHPGIDLEIICKDDQSVLEDMVWRGDADCGFAVFPLKHDLEALPLARDPLLVVVSPQHPLADASCFPARSLAEEPYVKLESGIFSEMDELFKRNGVEPNVRFAIDSDYAVMSMVSVGLGYTVLPRLILNNAPFPLAQLTPPVPTDREIALILRSEDTASEATRAFISCARRWVTETYRFERASQIAQERG